MLVINYSYYLLEQHESNVCRRLIEEYFREKMNSLADSDTSYKAAVLKSTPVSEQTGNGFNLYLVFCYIIVETLSNTALPVGSISVTNQTINHSGENFASVIFSEWEHGKCFMEMCMSESEQCSVDV